MLRALISAEVAARDEANCQIRLKQAGFPARKTLETFDVAASSIPRPTFEYLASLEWVRATENLLLVGKRVGKLIHSILRHDLILVDELGFAPLDETGSQRLFRFVAAAYEHRSLSS